MTTEDVTNPSGPKKVVTLATSYGYDLVGNRISTTDGNNHTSYTSYDVLNRITSQKDGAGNFVIVAKTDYDGLSRMTGRTDGKGSLTTLISDNAGRLNYYDQCKQLKEIRHFFYCYLLNDCINFSQFSC